MAYAIQGRIKRKFDVEVFPSGFKKQELVVTTEEQYPQDIKLTFMKEKADMLEPFQEGEVVVVNFDLRGREYQGKYYVDLSGWRIQPASEAGSGSVGMLGGASAGGSKMGGSGTRGAGGPGVEVALSRAQLRAEGCRMWRPHRRSRPAKMTTISHSDAPVSAASGSGSKEDHFRIQSWPNGFRLIYKQVDRAVTHCGVIVDAGSRDDPPGQSGCAHFLEHMLFQGTKKRRSYHVLNRMDSVGGEFNASTSKEDTWLHAAFRSQYLERAAELMSDILFGATLPEDEVEKERDVILDEILSYRDQPVEALWDAFEAELFAGHLLAAPVSGSDVSVGQITRSTILHFRDRCYVPGSMVWSVVGPTPWTDVVQLADRYFGQAPARPADRPRQPVPGRAPFDLRTHADIHQVHHVLGRTVVGGDHPDRTGLSLLANHLGGPSMNNRLMLNIRERHGLAYHTECSYQPFSDVGLFTIYFATDARQHEKAEQLIAKELRDVARTKLGVRQLHELKEQMLGHIALAQDSGSDLMMGLGKSLQQFGRVEPMESVLREIDAVTASDLLRLANEVLPWDGLSHRVFLPAAAPLNGK